jgi:hypothetical protein
MKKRGCMCMIRTYETILQTGLRVPLLVLIILQSFSKMKRGKCRRATRQ